MKQRFSSLDVKVIAHELNTTLTSLRISNIYDLSSRIFLIKFQKPDHKEQVIIDSGFRCHLTSFKRTTASAPSPFVQRLRKTLKSRRVTSVTQVGTDRIIQFEFSDGAFRLFLEFYAGGNIVLVDKELNVLACLRIVADGEEYERVKVGGVYNLSQRQNYKGVPELTKERLKLGLQQAVDRQQKTAAEKKGKKNTKDALRKGLAVSISELPPMLLDHAMKIKTFDSTLKPEDVLSSEELLDKLLEVLREAQKTIISITSSDIVTGYILAKGGPKDGETAIAADGSQASKTGLKYDDFHPFKPAQYADDPAITFLDFSGFNKTVDEFFSSIEGQKLESRLHEREEAARKKLEQTKQDHAKRIGGLQQVQEINVRKAEAITANVERVEEAQAAVNGLIAQGMDWVDIAKLIEKEQTRDNPVAKLIKLPLKLYENTVTLLLGEAQGEIDDDESDFGEETESESDSSDSDDEGSESKPRKAASKPIQDNILAIDIDLSLSAWTNASQYYDQKKSAVVKQEKTLQSSTIALKSAERKIAADLKKGLKVEKEILRPVRKLFWFEKFHYFISSDGYLVLGGKDAQQNEILYRRYLRKGDLYVHADVNGACVVVIKNNPSTPDAPIPPSTLSQAGTLSVVSSSAWDSKALMAAWWVTADQVSKAAPTGEFLPVGNFNIKGKKNFLPPAQMLLGFAVMFQISEESKGRHRKHRVDGPAKKEESSGGVMGSIGDVDEDDGKAENEDSDEDFPDATLETSKIESDDEDFPDAKFEDGKVDSDADEPAGAPVESDSEDEDSAPSNNPLQASFGTATKTKGEDDEGIESDLEADGESAHTPALVQGLTNKSNPPRHLSAKERRDLRKGIDPSALNTSSPQDDGSQISDTDTVAMSTTTNARSKNQPLPRGKRTKLKKAAAKYAYQDEEDRALAMQLLGSKSGQEAAAAEAEARREKEEEEKRNKERRREQHLKAQEVIAKGEEARKAALEGDNEEEDEDVTRLSLLNLDAFVGRPLPGDDLLAIIPVCAPWSALSTYKYKAKLQPGATKKGKAVNEVLSRWQTAGQNPKWIDKEAKDVERIWPKEVELLSGIKGIEVNGVVPVTKVRVLMAGGSAGGGKGGGSNSASGKGKGNGKSSRGGRGSKKKK